MKNKLIIGAVILIVVISTIIAYNYTPKDNLLGGSVNWVTSVTNSATSTDSGVSPLPALVLDVNTARTGAKIMNPSDTDIYLHLGTFGNASLASTSVKLNEGIFLDALVGEYTITSDNLWTGQVYATSTAGGKIITTIEY